MDEDSCEYEGGDARMFLNGCSLAALSFYSGLYRDRVLPFRSAKELCVQEFELLSRGYCPTCESFVRGVFFPFTRAELSTLSRALVQDQKAVLLWRDDGTLRVTPTSLEDVV